MSAIDMMVIPSFSEASPMVFFESQACGLPVLASDLPVFRNYKDQGAWCYLFDPNSSDSFASSLSEAKLAISDGSRYSDMRERALSFASSYSLDSYARKLEIIYDSLC
jgi:glycosyltransferase involved in cell wall biosynthesis